MNRVYQRYHWIATLCVAVIIVNVAFLLLVANKRTYRTYIAKQETTEAGISGFEASLVYEQLVGCLRKFTSSEFEVKGYTLTEDELARLKNVKRYYRRAVILTVLATAVVIYCLWNLSRRRHYACMIIGPALAAFYVALKAIWMLLSKKDFPVAVRHMLFHGEYDYFGGATISGILPADYAGHMLLSYVLYVIALAAAVLLVRFLIYYWGRPHKF